MEPLLYLFYGRPAYKNSLTKHSRFNFHFPVCFILDSHKLPAIKRIFPFDTGAFSNGLYDSYLHKSMALRDFEMTPQMTAIKKTVNYFFDTNDNYFTGTPRTSIQNDLLEFEIEAYHKLINGFHLENPDDRKASIEIQLGEDLRLSKDNLKAVILPDHFMHSPLVQKTIIEEWKAAILPYRCYGNSKPDHYYSQLLSITENYLKGIPPIC